MGALNAVMAHYVLLNSEPSIRTKIAKEVEAVMTSVYPRHSWEKVCQTLAEGNYVVQLNFVALACDNLGISPPGNNAWTRPKNPFALQSQIRSDHIDIAIHALEKQDKIKSSWSLLKNAVNFENLLDGKHPYKVPTPDKADTLSNSNGASKAQKSSNEGIGLGEGGHASEPKHKPPEPPPSETAFRERTDRAVHGRADINPHVVEYREPPPSEPKFVIKPQRDARITERTDRAVHGRAGSNAEIKDTGAHAEQKLPPISHGHDPRSKDQSHSDAQNRSETNKSQTVGTPLARLEKQNPRGILDRLDPEG